MAKILVTDDANLMRNILKDILVKAGHQVDTAKNGAEAVRMAKAYAYDLILMDIVMPEENGLDALRDIMSANKDQRVVMISALGEKPMVEDAIRYGAIGYVTKPVSREDVLYNVEKYLK
jgi:two-component system chemotaxis response regulator CheY